MNLTLFALYTVCVLPLVLAGAGGLFSKELCTCNLCTEYCVCITSGPGWSWGRILKRVMHMQPVYCVCIITYQWAWLELGGVISKEFYTYNLCTVCVLSVGLAGAAGWRILRRVLHMQSVYRVCVLSVGLAGAGGVFS